LNSTLSEHSVPSVVVFDLGKVLLDFDYGVAARAFATESTVGADTIRALLDQSPLLHRLESGRLDEDGFEQEVRRQTGFRGDRAAFRRKFGEIFSEIPEMIGLHGKLRERGIRTVVFSNTNGLAVEHIRSRYPFFNRFDGWILSHEVGAMKPEVRAYEAVELLTGATGSALLYVDDRPENIEAGRQRGWRTILHSNPSATIAEVHSHVPGLGPP